MAGVDSEDHELICLFLRRVHGTLDDVVGHLDGLIPMRGSNLGHQAALEQAWAEWKVRPGPENEGQITDGGRTNRLHAIEVHIRSGAVDADLVSHGLTGKQLRFKLAVFEARYAVFKGMRNPSAPQPGLLVRLLVGYQNRRSNRHVPEGQEATDGDIGAGT
jgi:hypothetical protein